MRLKSIKKHLLILSILFKSCIAFGQYGTQDSIKLNCDNVYYPQPTFLHVSFDFDSSGFSFDTIPCRLLCSDMVMYLTDTAKGISIRNDTVYLDSTKFEIRQYDNANYYTPFIIKGYEVRRLRDFRDDVISFDDYPQPQTKYIHIEYLDENKKPLNKNYIVWLSK